LSVSNNSNCIVSINKLETSNLNSIQNIEEVKSEYVPGINIPDKSTVSTGNTNRLQN